MADPQKSFATPILMMMDSQFSLFYTTCPDISTAQKIAQTLLQEKLIACVNMLNGMQSLYWWEGQIESSTECILILKTKTELKERLRERFETLHPYQVPCFLEISIDSGNFKYLNWLSDSLN